MTDPMTEYKAAADALAHEVHHYFPTVCGSALTRYDAARRALDAAGEHTEKFNSDWRKMIDEQIAKGQRAVAENIEAYAMQKIHAAARDALEESGLRERVAALERKDADRGRIFSEVTGAFRRRIEALEARTQPLEAAQAVMRAENERMRKALEELAGIRLWDDCDVAADSASAEVRSIARAALTPAPKGKNDAS